MVVRWQILGLIGIHFGAWEAVPAIAGFPHSLGALEGVRSAVEAKGSFSDELFGWSAVKIIKTSLPQR